MRGIQFFLGMALLVLIAFGTSQHVTLTGDLRAMQAEIDTLDAQIRETRLEKIRLEAEVNDIGGNLSELDDTTRAARMGVAMKQGFSLAKQLHVLDNKELRAKRRAEALREDHAALRKRRLWLDLGVGAGALVAFATLLALRRIS